MTAARTQTLPRSLHPLPGESLGGFLLRLSYRLNLSPTELARRGGILKPAASIISRRTLLDLDIRRFAAFARLSEPEAAALTLTPWAQRYPPITRSLRAPDHRVTADDWLFNPTLRYCPRCLAGEKDTAPDESGGCWQLVWHLPISFACPDHAVILRHGCPQPHPAGQHHHVLISRGGESRLHPAQCRQPRPGHARPGRGSPPCDQRLDQPSLPELTQATPEALTLQRRILAMFEPAHPAEDATTYLTDLRVVTALLHSSWAYSQDLIDPAAQAQTHQHIEELGAGGRNALDRPPRHPLAAAGLLTAAAAVLDDPGMQATLTQDLRRTWNGRPSNAPWVEVFTRHSEHCSPQLRHAFEPATRAFQRTSGSHSPKAPARTSGYGVEHVPAFLEQPWFDEHLATLARGSVAKVARRLAAATLVQWAIGGSLGDAAHYLGINPAKGQYAPTKNLAQRLVELEPGRFTQALHDIAQQLDATTSRTDYHHRRQALKHWSLTPGEWAEIIDRLPPVPGPVQPVLDDRKRQEASAYIWALTTRGEHRFAPRPIEAAQPPDVRRNWQQRRGATDFQIARPDPLQHYAALRDQLHRHAEKLAAAIDHGKPPSPDIRNRTTPVN